MERQTWGIWVAADGAQAIRDPPELGLEFPRDAFASDPCLATLNWERGKAK